MIATSAAAVVLAVGVLPAAATSGAEFSNSGLENKGNTNLCLDLGGYLNGSPARSAPCQQSAASQRWTLLDSGLLVNDSSGNGCLDLTSYQNGGRAVLNRCDERVTSQLWDYEPIGQPGSRDGGTLRNIGSGNGCVQIATYADKTPLTLTRCDNSDLHQRWWHFAWLG